jgi:undecaprenyl diphosphate synthase
MNQINHVAIIMDGNGRWGIKYKKTRNAGHNAGLKSLETIIRASISRKIKYLTLYAFSTENWKRPKKEVNFLLNLLETFLSKKINEFNKQNIKLKVIGEKKFSNKLNNLLNLAENLTSNNKKLQVNLAINYGSKVEIINAIKQLIKKKSVINEKTLVKHLYTKDIPDPELLIRTGNRKRLSNFLLWQLAYSEIFFVKKLWPDFNEKDYIKILNQFKNIKRNFGKI